MDFFITNSIDGLTSVDEGPISRPIWTRDVIQVTHSVQKRFFLLIFPLQDVSPPER